MKPKSQKHRVLDDPKNATLQTASRTDAGVSALCNVIAFNSEFQKHDIVNILNSQLKDCWCYGVASVEEDFNPRNVNNKSYRYHLFNDAPWPTANRNYERSQKLDPDRLRSIFEVFQGTHDFKNFVNPHVSDTIRTINSITLLELGDDWLIIDITGKGFLWHQVRRLINAWVRYAIGELEADELENALNEPNHRIDFGLAPPEPLFLMDIEYDFKFEINNQMLHKLQEDLINIWYGNELQQRLFQYLFKKI